MKIDDYEILRPEDYTPKKSEYMDGWSLVIGGMLFIVITGGLLGAVLGLDAFIR